MSTNKSKTSALTRVQALIAGTKKNFPNGQFNLVGTSYTTATLVQAFQSLVDAFAPVDGAHAQVRDTVAALRAAEAKVAPLIKAYTSFLRSTFSNAAQLGDFGLPAPKAHTALDTEKRAVATAKMRATRAARGTTSKKKKLAVKGDVSGVLVTPVTHAQSATPPATPAGPAPTATANSGASK
jgi:ABC-type transporter Mla subunit MlaD